MQALAIFLLSFAGLNACALAMMADALPRPPRTRLVLRASGAAALLLALMLAILRYAALAQGLLLWTGMLTIAALAVALQLTYARRTTHSLALVAAAGGLLATMLR